MVVQCTWKTAEGRDVGSAVTWSSVDEKQNGDVEDEVQAENCLLLFAPSAGTSEYLTVPACQLLLSCQPPDQIQYLSILSEAKVLEVYGHHGEYIKTMRNELLEEVEDMVVYRGDIKLDRPLQVCSIKFACLRSKNEMWLYGVKVIVSKAVDTPENALKIQFSEVEQRLQEMGLELSDKAEAFKQLVQCHQQNISKFGPQDLNTFIQVLNLLNLTQGRTSLSEAEGRTVNIHNSDLVGSNRNGTCNKNSAQLPITAYGGEFSSKSAKINENESFPKQSCSTQTDNPPPKSDLDLLKEYIDSKFLELDKELWGRIQKQFHETEAKLLCKLDEIESYVKPQGLHPTT